MSSVAGSSRHILHARIALENELQRISHYQHHIQHASNMDEKLYFTKTFFEFLRTNHIKLSQHVGFRLFILDQIANARKIARERRYAAHPHMKPILTAIADVEKIIRETPIKGAF